MQGKSQLQRAHCIPQGCVLRRENLIHNNDEIHLESDATARPMPTPSWTPAAVHVGRSCCKICCASRRLPWMPNILIVLFLQCVCFFKVFLTSVHWATQQPEWIYRVALKLLLTSLDEHTKCSRRIVLSSPSDCGQQQSGKNPILFDGHKPETCSSFKYSNARLVLKSWAWTDRL